MAGCHLVKSQTGRYSVFDRWIELKATKKVWIIEDKYCLLKREQSKWRSRTIHMVKVSGKSLKVGHEVQWKV